MTEPTAARQKSLQPSYLEEFVHSGEITIRVSISGDCAQAKEKVFYGDFASLLPQQVATSRHYKINGGRGGIRTPDTLSGTPVFKTGAINHSATLPCLKFSTLLPIAQKTLAASAPTRCNQRADSSAIYGIYTR